MYINKIINSGKRAKLILCSVFDVRTSQLKKFNLSNFYKINNRKKLAKK